MNLKEFLEQPLREPFAVRADIHVPGFNRLYARRGPYMIDGTMRSGVLQLANFEAEEPGNGAFTKLLKALVIEPFGGGSGEA